jgi:hypothetical protein
MNDDSQPKDAPPNPTGDPGTPTIYAVRERALELALLHGRSVSDVSDFDREQAILELTVHPATNHKDDL